MEIRDYICELVFKNQAQKLSKSASEHFGISRQAAQKHIRKLVDEGILIMSGTTNSAKYILALMSDKSSVFKISTEITEDVVWRSSSRPKSRLILRKIPTPLSLTDNSMW